MRRALLLTFLVACTSPSPASDDAGAPDGGSPDAGLPDAGPPPADEYCERTVAMFCGYYLRCGRMAVADEAECRAVFLETCNARYEARYAMLEAAGLLRLSASGLAACAAHLETVECARQIRDLDGPCALMWTGTVPAGGACGFDVESLVCAPGATCTLGLDLCGTCRAAAGDGESCGGDVGCGGESSCEDGTCVRRRLPGESCAGGARCVLGASCVDDVCAGPTYVAVGQACNQAARCPYKSLCVQGVCVESALLDESCGGTTTCASGLCESGTCVALRARDEECTTASECASGYCADGVCTALPSACFDG